MSQDTENFEQLRRLLALKRHEQPPPGYYHNFAREVIVRIKAGETGERPGFLDRLFEEAQWLQRIWAAFETKPILAGVSGVAVCGLLLAGVLYSDMAEVTPTALVPGADTGSAAQAQVSLADHPLFTKPVVLETSSTSPIAAGQSDALLLDGIARLRAQPAGFSFSVGN